MALQIFPKKVALQQSKRANQGRRTIHPPDQVRGRLRAPVEAVLLLPPAWVGTRWVIFTANLVSDPLRNPSPYGLVIVMLGAQKRMAAFALTTGFGFLLENGYPKIDH